MSALIRDAPIGQIIRFATRNRLFQYPEEKSDFECPTCYMKPGEAIEKALSEKGEEEEPHIEHEKIATPTEPTIEEGKEFVELERREEVEEAVESRASSSSDPDRKELEKIPTAQSDFEHHQTQFQPIRTVHTQRTTAGIERVSTRLGLQQSHTRADLENQFTKASLAPGPSRPIIPEQLEDGTILVDWYATDDPENPQNWSFKKKIFVTFQICMYTLAVYMGSAIITPSEPGIMQALGGNIQVVSMVLSMYVLAYGMGPMLFSPLSEIPAIGRNPPYMITFALFVILLVPTALADNLPGLIVLRFLLGFFGSPCLATGGASLQDMFSLIKLPYVMSIWALSATCGPALGPIISGFSVTAENWRWSSWELLWLAGPVWLLMFFSLPETSPQNILLRRAQRLRKLSGDKRLKSQSEIDQGNMKVGAVVAENLWRPNQMMLLDPAVGFTALYVALVYGIYYSFFEAFPLVYIDMYHFNIGQMGLTFLSITVGVLIAIALYWSYNWWVVEPDLRKNGLGAPEKRLIPAIFASFLCPIGLFLFGWTSNQDIHWIVSVVGIMIFTIGVFIIIQCIFLYLPLTYPQYAASLFAGNDFTRSTLACGAIHFSRPLYGNLGVGRGCSLLGGLTAGCILGVFYLYFQGHNLRARSRFSAK